MATQFEIDEYNKGKGRVVFVEPNDVSGKVGKTTITPDYTDFCIGFRLTAEIVNRASMNEYGAVDSQKRDVTISWRSGMNKDGKSWVSFLDGSKVDGSDKRYLTTYYTDISASDIAREDVVEGLGVESVNISFENYFVPTVKIKFIDVRGSGLFAREEALHFGDKLTAENVFGCFFTVPYPKFRLQIKGFYGKPVTYQLYCSNFKGSFNASNGYYEADVTFVGYTYGILSDVPMGYIMAAPYCKWWGSGYWDENSKNNLSWKLYGDGDRAYDPVRLMELADNIRNTVAGDRTHILNVLNNKEKRSIERIVRKSDVCKGVTDSYDAILNACKSLDLSVGNTEITDERSVKVFFRKEYDAESGVDLNIVPSSDDHNQKNEEYINQIKTLFSRIDTSAYNNAIDLYNSTFGRNYGHIEDVYDDITAEYNSAYSVETKKYVYSITAVIKYPKSYDDALNELNNCYNDTEIIRIDSEGFEETNNITIASFMGMYPFIGNVFRDVMCHLETFMYMFKECVNEINSQIASGNRTFKTMGIPLNSSDVSTDKDNQPVPAFPGIMVDVPEDASSGDSENYESPTASMLKYVGWLGDFGEASDIPEVKFVNSIFEALTTRNPDKKTNGTSSSEIRADDEAKLANENRDIKVAIYTHLKNIYDRWLYTTDFEQYRVYNMMKNIVFMDSFFRDMSNVLHLNPKIVGDLLDSSIANDGRILKFIDNVASRHHCMIFGFPDTFIFSNDGDGSGTTEMTRKLIEAFTPMPYNDMGDAEQMNKIVVVYTNKPSEIVNESNGYMGDYFDVYSDGEVIPSQLDSSNSPYGYMIPSFGVTFGRQDNAIFKSVNISMENPIATEQSIVALTQLAGKAGGTKSKIQYYGQDIYQVYSGYSYFCEFEMMGCMQITPMMYFQLLNIPMFRGAYMVISVSHSMTVGDMVTRVRGMRLSRNALPLTKKWFVPDNLTNIMFDENGNISNVNQILNELTSDLSSKGFSTNSSYTTSDDITLSDDYQDVMKSDYDTKFRYLFDGNYGDKYSDKNKNMISLANGATKESDYNAEQLGYINNYIGNFSITTEHNGVVNAKINVKLMDSLAKIIEEADKEGVTNIRIVSSLRFTTTGSGYVSNHCLGAAVDVCAYGNADSNIHPFVEVENTNPFSNSNENMVKVNNVSGNPWFNEKEYKEALADKSVGGKYWLLVDAEGGGDDANCIRTPGHKLVKIFQNYGWDWGGTYGDTMHFSFFGGN